MNCYVCGNPVPGDAAVCPVCGTYLQNNSYVQQQPGAVSGSYQQPGAVSGSYTAYQQPGAASGSYHPYQQPAADYQQNGYPQNGYPQGSYTQPGYEQNAYPQGGYQQPAGYDPNAAQQPAGYDPNGYSQPNNYGTNGGYQQPSVSRQPSAFVTGLLGSVKKLPGRLLKSFTDPGAVLRELAEDNDYFTAPIVVLFALIMTFFAGMLILRGVIYTAAAMSGQRLTGENYAYAMRYAGVSPAGVGGIAVLVQLLILAVCTGIYTAYACLIKKVPFSLELVLGFVAVANIPAAVLTCGAVVFSLIWVGLAVLMVLCSAVFGICHANRMLTTMIGNDNDYILRVAVICVVLFAAILISSLLGSSFATSIISRLM